MEVGLLPYPKKSHRKSVISPGESAELAEFLGVVLGDGGISNPWQIVISLNALTDREYAIYLVILISTLFRIDAVIRKRLNEQTLVVVLNSTTVVDYVITKGAVRGNKIKQAIRLPTWINGKHELEIAFLRGMLDTDGCTYIDHHRYKEKIYNHLGIAFTSYSPLLCQDICEILKRHGYSPTLTTKNRVLLRKEREVIQFFAEINPKNKRHYTKLQYFLEEYRSGHNGTVSKAVVAVQ